MKICYFGANDPSVYQNKVPLRGFVDSGYEILYVHKLIVPEPFDSPEHAGFLPIVKRLLRKLSLVWISLRHLDKLIASDLIFVGYPGHLELILAKFYAVLLCKPLIFYPCVILTASFTEDIHVMSGSSFKSKLLYWFEKFTCRLPDILIADTIYQKEYFVQEFQIDQKNVEVLPLGADENAYPFSGYNQAAEKFIVMYYGLFNPIHGVEYMIEAAKLCEADPKIEFWFVGKGNTYQQAVDRAKALESINIRFLPDVVEKNSREVLAKANVFLGFIKSSPTVKRTVPNKVYQGMALGKVVVTADMPVMRSMFKDGENIVLCEPDSSEGLAKAILEVKASAAKATGIAQQSYELYTKEFSTKALGAVCARIVNTAAKK